VRLLPAMAAMPASAPPRYSHHHLPPYSYVPGLFPHPTSDQRGHSFGHQPQPSPPLDELTYRNNDAYLYAIDLFNHGFYWEAHEAWESLWHAAGRRGATADFLKGLIKLAAAGVKARECRPVGVRQHAQRAKELLRGIHSQSVGAQTVFGLRLPELITAASQTAQNAAELTSDAAPDPLRRLPIVLLLNP